MDTVTKGQRDLLLFILGVAILVIPIRYIAIDNFNERKEIVAEADERTVYYNDLKAKDNNRQQYIDDTAAYEEEYEAILAEFPSELYQENTIMYLKGIKDEYELTFPSVSMGEETLFYTLGTGAAGDVTLDESSAETTDEDGTVTTTGISYNCYSASFPVSYEGSYEAIKDVIDYIENGDYRMTVDSIDISYDEGNDLYSGSMTFTSYAVNGEDRVTDQVDVNVQTGKDSIFGSPAANTTTTTTTTDSDESAE